MRQQLLRLTRTHTMLQRPCRPAPAPTVGFSTHKTPRCCTALAHCAAKQLQHNYQQHVTALLPADARIARASASSDVKHAHHLSYPASARQRNFGVLMPAAPAWPQADLTDCVCVLTLLPSPLLLRQQLVANGQDACLCRLTLSSKALHEGLALIWVTSLTA